MCDEDYLDVSGFLEEAVERMEVGELIHGEDFSLQDSMAAIGLMNPKMDVGFGDRVRAYDVDLKWNLSPEELVSLADEFLRREAVWLEAHTLPQTIYASVYLLRMEECRSPLLNALLRMTATRVSLLKDIIAGGKTTTDDEDFLAGNFGLPLIPILSIEENANLATAAYAELPAQTSDPYVSALRNRIVWRALYHGSLICMVQCQQLDYPEEVISKLQHTMEVLRKSKETMAKVPAPGFDERVTRHLILTSPPRSTTFLSTEEAYDYYERNLDQLIQMCTLSVKYLSEENVMSGCMMTYTLNMIALYNSRLRPTTLSRSILQRMIVDPFLVTKLIGDKVRIETFGSSLHQSIMLLLETLCRNRARQRRKLLRVLNLLKRDKELPPNADEEGPTESIPGNASEASIEIIRQLYAKASISEKKKSFLFPSAGKNGSRALDATLLSLEVTIFVVTHHLVLGFECDLYSNFELHAVYTNLINLMEISVQVHSHASNQSPLRQFLRFFDEGRMDLSRVMEITLRRANVFWHPNSLSQLGSESKWYHDRFEPPESNVGLPTYLTYAEFVATRDSSKRDIEDAAALLKSARSNFEKASRLCVQWTSIGQWFHDEVRDLAKTAIANSVEFIRASKILGSKEEISVNLKFVHHRHFPVVSFSQ
ncbi:hypothetical protein NDN08_002395 [Rhodosorus marinus]|uniref:Uncharacterized protein n=1 Tax=Rhodosorus marinus TaxID=101924 RepID=A0AAV8UY10_9RHOD|nr:hypothetical protein NDN08_002395 [Rhodosorus marinus]